MKARLVTLAAVLGSALVFAGIASADVESLPHPHGSTWSGLQHPNPDKWYSQRPGASAGWGYHPGATAGWTSYRPGDSIWSRLHPRASWGSGPTTS